jgi:hypothetical protein
MSVQEMRKVMTGFNHQMKDGVSDATERRMQQQMNDVGETSRRSRKGQSEEEYYDEESSFAPSRVRNTSERAYLKDVAEDDGEFDEQVSEAVRQYQGQRRGAPSKYSAPARQGGRGGNDMSRGSRGGQRRGGGNSAPTQGRRASAGGGRGERGGSRGGVRAERSDPTMGYSSRTGERSGRGGPGGDQGGADIERHKQRVEELKNQVRKLQSDIPNLMKDYERQRRGKEDTDRKLQSLERQLKERTKELSIRNADNLALKKENEELIRANEDWKRRFEGKERELATQQKAVIKLQYLVEWYMSREQRFKAVSRAEMEELVDEQSHGQKQMEQVDRKLKNGLMNKMEHQQRTYASFVESVRKQTHMLKKKEDEVKRLRGGLIEKERFLMEQDKLNESLSKELLSNSMDVYKKTVKNYLDKAAH